MLKTEFVRKTYYNIRHFRVKVKLYLSKSGYPGYPGYPGRPGTPGYPEK